MTWNVSYLVTVFDKVSDILSWIGWPIVLATLWFSLLWLFLSFRR